MDLETFKNTYYPKLKQGQLAAWMGVSDAQYSRVKGEYESYTSDAFKTIASWMKNMHNVILTYKDPKYAAKIQMEEKYSAIIRAKDKEIAKLKEQVRQLQIEVKSKEQIAPILADLEKVIIAKYKNEENNKKRKKE